jgi:hypothetical protein
MTSTSDGVRGPADLTRKSPALRGRVLGSGSTLNALRENAARSALLDVVAAGAMPDAIFEEITHYLATAFEGLVPFDRIAIVTAGDDGDQLTLRGAWVREAELFLPPRYSVHARRKPPAVGRPHR